MVCYIDCVFWSKIFEDLDRIQTNIGFFKWKNRFSNTNIFEDTCFQIIFWAITDVIPSLFVFLLWFLKDFIILKDLKIHLCLWCNIFVWRISELCDWILPFGGFLQQASSLLSYSYYIWRKSEYKLSDAPLKHVLRVKNNKKAGFDILLLSNGRIKVGK